MAKKKNSGSKINLGLILLLFGAALAVGIVGQRTHWFNFAAGPAEQAVNNLNSTSDNLAAVNPDDTMGPKTSAGNWSNSLPASLKGNLVFAVIDPILSPTPTKKLLYTYPKDKHGSCSTQKNGPQEVTALDITITKVEVHIAHLGTSAKPADHWETLSLTTPFTVDLVELAATNDVAKLGITSLAEGRYTEVRLYLSGAKATFSDGTVADLRILGKDHIVRVVRSFTVVNGKTTTLTMDFDAQHSVIKSGNTCHLRPVVARLLETKQ